MSKLTDQEAKQFVMMHLMQTYSEEDYVTHFPPNEEFKQIMRYHRMQLDDERTEIHDVLTHNFSETGKVSFK